MFENSNNIIFLHKITLIYPILKEHKHYKKIILNYNWLNDVYKYKLTEKFIEDFQDKLDWYYISFSQKLSCDFMRKFKNKIYWPFISKTQQFDRDFINDFAHKLDMYWVSKNIFMSEKNKEYALEFIQKVITNKKKYKKLEKIL